MGKGRFAAVAAFATIAVTATLAPAVGAAELQGDYQFQGTRASSGPGPALVELGPGDTFATENVMGEARQVLRFVQGGALQMDPFPVEFTTSKYSIVMTVRLDDVNPVTRLLDPTDGNLSRGLQVTGGHLDVYNGGSNLSAGTPLSSNTWATVALVVASPPIGTRGYVNGNYVAGGSNVVMDTFNKKLRFFAGATDSAGAVSCIRAYTEALTPEEVTAIGASARCGAPGPPAPPPVEPSKPKCKKKKKKGKKRALTAKKKHKHKSCKKKKKGKKN